MRKMILLACALSLTAHADMRDKWEKVRPGQTEDQALEIMGADDYAYLESNTPGAHIDEWRIDDSTECAVKINAKKHVEKKSCKLAGAAREQALAQEQRGQIDQQNESLRQQRIQSALMLMQLQKQMQINIPPIQQAPQAMPAYQMPLRQHTNCTTSLVGGQAYTQCY